MAPVNLRERFEALIKREIKKHEAHGKGHLIFKMNALVDPEMIRLLYRASQAGVKVDLLVRGRMLPAARHPGVSENIRVTSIVGRFLEHSRIFYFRNGGDEEIYLGSADLMPRNLNRRVELLFPVEDANLRRRIRDEILETYLLDNVKARRMQSDGTYKRAARGDHEKPLEQPGNAAESRDPQSQALAAGLVMRLATFYLADRRPCFLAQDKAPESSRTSGGRRQGHSRPHLQQVPRLDRFANARKSREDWESIVERMGEAGLKMSDEEYETVSRTSPSTWPLIVVTCCNPRGRLRYRTLQ